MVDLVKQKRNRHETTRPAIVLPVETWNKFTIKYRTGEVRNKLIEDLLILQLNSNIINTD